MIFFHIDIISIILGKINNLAFPFEGILTGKTILRRITGPRLGRADDIRPYVMIAPKILKPQSNCSAASPFSFPGVLGSRGRE